MSRWPFTTVDVVVLVAFVMTVIFAVLIFVLLATAAPAMTVTQSGAVMAVDYDLLAAYPTGEPVTDYKESRVSYQLPGETAFTVCSTVPAPTPTLPTDLHVSTTCTVPVVEDQEPDVMFHAESVDLAGNVSLPAETIQRVDRRRPPTPR